MGRVSLRDSEQDAQGETTHDERGTAIGKEGQGQALRRHEAHDDRCIQEGGKREERHHREATEQVEAIARTPSHARAGYCALWTLGLWLLFGTYMLVLWLIGAAFWLVFKAGR